MYLFLTSIREKTTDIAKWQAERLGFKVILLGQREKWVDKYKRFLELANEDCFRCDADIILNKNILNVSHVLEDMIQYNTYDLYRNNVGITSPVFYSKRALDLLKNNLDILDQNHPETSAWRFIEKQGLLTYTDDTIVGFHGFYQNQPAIQRAKKNKIERNQMHLYDFKLADKIYEDLH